MMGGGMQNISNAFQGLSSAALSGMLYGNGTRAAVAGSDIGAGSTTANAASNVSTDPRLIPSMTKASTPMYGSSFGTNNRMSKNPGMWDDYEPPTPLGIFSKPNLTRLPNAYGGSNFNSGFLNNDLFNPVY